VWYYKFMEAIMDDKALVKHIKNAIVTHTGSFNKGALDALWAAHMSCRTGEWEDDGELVYTLKKYYTQDVAIQLVTALTRTTLVNDDSALDG
jgi:hypothetical protein